MRRPIWQPHAVVSCHPNSGRSHWRCWSTSDSPSPNCGNTPHPWPSCRKVEVYKWMERECWYTVRGMSKPVYLHDILLSPTQGLSRSKANVVHVHIFNEKINVQNIVDAHSIFKSQNSIFRMFNNPKFSDAKSHHCSIISKTQRTGCSPYSSKKCPLRKLHEFLNFQGTCNGQKWGSPSNFTRALMSAFASLMSPRCIRSLHAVSNTVSFRLKTCITCCVGHVIFHWHRACQKVSMLVLEGLGWFRACKGAIICANIAIPWCLYKTQCVLHANKPLYEL